MGTVALCDTASALADMSHAHCINLDCSLRLCRNPGERGVGFVALGDTASALAAVGCTRGMEAVLPRVADQVREAITAPRGRARPHCPEALQVRPAS